MMCSQDFNADRNPFLLSPTATDSPLLLPALRLFIPPLRLVSAAMWHVVQRGSVQDYGMVEEFVSTVSEMVPELLNADQKAQLLLGLRARVWRQSLYVCTSEKYRVAVGY